MAFLLRKHLRSILRGDPFVGGFLRVSEGRPKDLGGPHADQIFVFRGSPKCFAVLLLEEKRHTGLPATELVFSLT